MGPAVGTLSLQLWPEQTHSSVVVAFKEACDTCGRCGELSLLRTGGGGERQRGHSSLRGRYRCRRAIPCGGPAAEAALPDSSLCLRSPFSPWMRECFCRIVEAVRSKCGILALRLSQRFVIYCCSVMSDSAASWTVARQAPLSMGFSRQEYWSGLPFPSPGDLPNPGIEPISPALQADSLPLSHQGSPVAHLQIPWVSAALRLDLLLAVCFL